MNLNQAQPCGANGHWQLPEALPVYSATLQDWLVYPGSLTARLRQHCQQFSIQVLFEGYAEIAEHEAKAVACQGPYWVREVLLCCDGQAWVFARSVIPKSSLEGDAAAISRLANKPLGELLFTDKGQRQTLELCQIEQNSSIYQHAQTQQALWGRRSRFLLASAPLLVAEIFLPNSLAYQGEDGVAAS
ncbi:chorismate lyase [Agarivorans sp. 2_MG-2023]|uniref:chorismate--pyruvate lyase family protein n=1 Tax=Agarivorans sp. 2_MG-2023 TaxID=3062647 RepID=UPI0026E2A904|nr:chorismate lyase [Agarivorans sp. 2_MG-2023]MDO6687563.1 chorismate lyase [Agarivorans sp. 3_MG-2023]MDO6717104.1 chorismate lyase [Agarivorans sp. 2_MG-2023]